MAKYKASLSKNNEDTEESTDKTSKESPDDEEQEDTEEEESDKTSVEGEEEGEEEDEEDEEETDVTKQYFTDPNSLPKEVRGAFKKMQAVFTRKMQAASLVTKKAEAFDQLVMDQEFRNWMEERQTGVKKTSKKSKSDDENEDDDSDVPLTRKTLRSEITAALTPIFRDRQDSATREEADKFKKDNPGLEIYKDVMVDILSKHPTLSYEEAFDLASRDDRRVSSKKESIDGKKKANISKPNKTGARGTEKKGKMTIREAFEAATKKLGIKE